MLMQNFKSAADLVITDLEHGALIKVLGMLERGDLVQVDGDKACDNGFNMGVQGKGCGTPACIGGWVAYLTGQNAREYVDGYQQVDYSKPAKGLTDLYWNEIGVYECHTTDRAATALRSYLTTGDARWDLAVA